MEKEVRLLKDSKKEKGLRYNEGKPRWSLVDFDSLEPMVRVLEYGADKYTVGDVSGADNWKKGFLTSEICNSLLRHIFALLRGEMDDVDSGLSHVGHILSNAMFLSYMIKEKPEFNDLIKSE